MTRRRKSSEPSLFGNLNPPSVADQAPRSIQPTKKERATAATVLPAPATGDRDDGPPIVAVPSVPLEAIIPSPVVKPVKPLTPRESIIPFIAILFDHPHDYPVWLLCLHLHEAASEARQHGLVAEADRCEARVLEIAGPRSNEFWQQLRDIRDRVGVATAMDLPRPKKRKPDQAGMQGRSTASR